jgi:tRNA threonylcarbamoyladenosine biosynthesis protein TsaB
MNEIYHATYEKRDGAWHAVHEPTVCAPSVAPTVAGAGWLGCGSGFRAYREALQKRYDEQLAAIEADVYPKARDIARLAEARFASGEAMPPELAAPVYVRNKVALRTDERASL